jgi:hypothetical protein
MSERVTAALTACSASFRVNNLYNARCFRCIVFAARLHLSGWVLTYLVSG